MIARIRGTVAEVRTTSVYLDLDDLTYEVFVPAVSLPELHTRIGQRVTLHTIQYIEGNTSFGNLASRLVGFLNEAERDFFVRFITVPGIGVNKGLKAMTMPMADIAGAIEARNVALLAQLPGVGKRTAEKAIAELNGKLKTFNIGAASTPTPVAGQDVQTEVLGALMGLGYRRGEAEDLIGRTLAGGAKGETVEQLLQECFRHTAP
jgi:Holliday junction DNA helicase RuvA